jgi:hypothetical protein
VDFCIRHGREELVLTWMIDSSLGTGSNTGSSGAQRSLVGDELDYLGRYEEDSKIGGCWVSLLLVLVKGTELELVGGYVLGSALNPTALLYLTERGTKGTDRSWTRVD